jgi:hypothetical protein
VTLLERANALRDRAERHHQFEMREGFAKVLRERTSELERHAKEIEGAQAKLEILTAVAPSMVLPSPMAMSKACITYRAVVAALDLWVMPPIDDGTTAWKPLKVAGKGYLEKLERLVKDSVEEQKKATLGVMSSADVEHMKNVPGNESEATTLAALRLELGVDWHSAKPERLRALLARAAEFKEKADVLRAKNVPDAVKAFFQEARSSIGAPYKKLTAEVLTWLEKNKQLERIRLVLR